MPSNWDWCKWPNEKNVFASIYKAPSQNNDELRASSLQRK